MRRAERPAQAPASLSCAAAQAEAEAAARHYETAVPGATGFKAYEFRRYREYDVVQALRELFGGKCAYCEGEIAKGASEVEHFRPKGGVGDAPDHPGYWWLALDWTNLLPTCPGCNKALHQHSVTETMTVDEVRAMRANSPKTLFGKANHFPIAGPVRAACVDDDHAVEDPLLIDPTRRDPGPELAWSSGSDYSIVLPARPAGHQSPYGHETIHCCGLNRLELVESRTKLLNTLKVQRIQIIEDLEASKDDPANLAIHVGYAVRRVRSLRGVAAPDQPFSAMAEAFLNALQNELRDWIVEHAPEALESLDPG